MRTSNPALREATFLKAKEAATSSEVMTTKGAYNKTFYLLIGALITASLTWKTFFGGGASAVMPMMIGGAIGGLIAAIVTIFKPSWAYISAPVYALLEGLFLGGISAILEAQFGGIVIQAVGLTFGVFLTMLMLYRSGTIKVTEKFRMGVFAATGGIALIYFASFMLNLFGMNMPYIHGNGMMGIGFSLVVVVIAALNLALDFDFIDRGAEAKAPKFMEWYAAFGLMVTLVWLYIEILRLLAKLQSRD